MLAGSKLPFNDKYMIKWAECANSFAVTLHDLEPENREAFYKKKSAVAYLRDWILPFGNRNGFQEPGDRSRGSLARPDGSPFIPFIREGQAGNRY